MVFYGETEKINTPKNLEKNSEAATHTQNAAI